MTIDPSREPELDGSPSAVHLVHVITRFLRVAYYRKNIIIAAVVVAGVLGALYYATATRIYQADAELLVLQTGTEYLPASMSPEGGRQGLMPTYEKLFTSAVVLEGAIAELSKMPARYRVDLADQPREKWVQILQQKLQARSLRRTNIIEVSYQSQSPDAAVEMVNAVVQSYLEFMEQNQKTVASEIVSLLKEERQQLDQRVQEKESEWLRVKAALGYMGLDESTKALPPEVETAIRLNNSLVEVQQRRIELQASLEAVRNAARTGGNVRQHLLAVDRELGAEVIRASMGMTGQDQIMVASLKQELLDKQSQVESLQATLGPMHPKITALNDSIRSIDAYLLDFQSNTQRRMADLQDGSLTPMVVSMIQEELSAVSQHEQRLQEQFDDAKQRAVTLNGQVAQMKIIEHNLNQMRNLKDALVTRIETINLNDTQAEVQVAVTGPPERATDPVSPRLSVVGLLCLLIGLGGGATVVYVLDVLDDRFRSPEEMQDQLGVPVLTMVHELEVHDGVGIDTLSVHVEPDSVASEAFRTLRTTLAFTEGDTNRLVVSSAEPGDGKTTVLANLAASYAVAGRKTLVIDADMRRPGMTKLFNLRGVGGLSEVLRAQDDVGAMCAERILNAGIDGLDLLPCGPRPSDPSELLSGPRMADILAWAETVYDFILIDGPPILAASDGALIGRLVDGLLLVVHPEKNHRRGVIRAVENIKSLGIQLVGTVVNRIGANGSRGYYGHDSAYGYGYGYNYGYGPDSDENVDEDNDVADGQDVTSDGRTEVDVPNGDGSAIAPRRVA